MRLKEFDALHEHASGAAARVVNSAVVKGFQDGDDGFDDAGGGVEFAAFHAFIGGELGDAVFISPAQQVFPRLRIPHVHIGEDVHDVAQHPFVQIRAGVVFGKDIFQAPVFGFNGKHGFINDLADFFRVRRRGHGGPARFFRDKEDIVRQIFVTVIFKAFPFRQERLEFPFKGAGDVAQENQADDDFAIVRGGDVPPQFAGGVPYLFSKPILALFFQPLQLRLYGRKFREDDGTRQDSRERDENGLDREATGLFFFYWILSLKERLWLSTPR